MRVRDLLRWQTQKNASRRCQYFAFFPFYFLPTTTPRLYTFYVLCYAQKGIVTTFLSPKVSMTLFSLANQDRLVSNSLHKHCTLENDIYHLVPQQNVSVEMKKGHWFLKLLILKMGFIIFKTISLTNDHLKLQKSVLEILPFLSR